MSWMAGYLSCFVVDKYTTRTVSACWGWALGGFLYASFLQRMHASGWLTSCSMCGGFCRLLNAEVAVSVAYLRRRCLYELCSVSSIDEWWSMTSSDSRKNGCWRRQSLLLAPPTFTSRGKGEIVVAPLNALRSNNYYLELKALLLHKIRGFSSLRRHNPTTPSAGMEVLSFLQFRYANKSRFEISTASCRL